MQYGSVNDSEGTPMTIRINPSEASLKPWEFPGFGKHSRITVPADELEVLKTQLNMPHKRLAEWPATAICGNDILSSCLYVSGLVAAKAGKLAPIALALVAGVLYLYRFIYGEVINAIPLNGGSYNVLLNTTSKRVASFAASLAILSYIATGVVSGTSACTYLATQMPSIDVVTATIVLLFFFAVLSFVGITESSVVALVIFIGHVLTLTVLCSLSIVNVVKHPEILFNNFNTDYPMINMAGEMVSGSATHALFFGMAAAMLGISGFESSSQFVQEQQDGVFPKGIRRASLGQTIMSLDEKVTEGGANFSVGQRQLLCIARSLLRRSKVILMDEATASIDVQTDQLIQRSIRKEFSECTCLTIAHRINTVMDSSRVLVMDKGSLAEFDTPDNLLQNKAGIFTSLVNEWRKGIDKKNQ